VDDRRPEVEAVAVLGNRIAAIGSIREIRKWIGANTMVIDLKGKRVTPGFNDSHAHLLDGGMELVSLQLALLSPISIVLPSFDLFARLRQT
jgi:predicted amidohydrolase YtcJ